MHGQDWETKCILGRVYKLGCLLRQPGRSVFIRSVGFQIKRAKAVSISSASPDELFYNKSSALGAGRSHESEQKFSPLPFAKRERREKKKIHKICYK